MTENVTPSVRRDAMVVKLHQGKVFAESLEGVGSRFVVRLPVDSVSPL